MKYLNLTLTVIYIYIYVYTDIQNINLKHCENKDFVETV